MSKARQLADLGNVYDDGALSNRNLIINSAMQVAQRGTSFTAQTNQFVVDRFNYNQSSSATMDLEQSTDAPDGFLNSAKLTVNAVDSSIAATDYSQIMHKIEGQNMAHLNWGSSSAKTVTLSFWVKCSVAGDWPFRLVNSDGSRSYAFYFTINAANTWEYKTKVIEGPTDGTFLTTNGVGIELGVTFAAGSTYAGATADQWNTVSGYASSNLANNTGWIGTTDNTFQITGVQLEVGDNASPSPFEHRSYSDELARCMRYYSVLGGGSYVGIDVGMQFSTTGSIHGVQYPAPMRASPSVSFDNLIATDRTGFDETVTGFSVITAGDKSAYIRTVWSTARGSTGRAILLAIKNGYTGGIKFDAEL